MKNTSYKYAKAGAVCYVLWGLLNMVAGIGLLQMAGSNPNVFLQTIAPLISESSLTDVSSNAAVGALASFHAFNLLWTGILVVIIAIKYNWKNRKEGYWFNMVIAGFINLGFLLFLFIPGYMPISAGFLIPLLFIIGAGLTTFALKQKDNLPNQQVSAVPE